jgi:hypothetical protein
MKDIQLNVTIEEANLILEALGNLPFARVYTLIGKIQEQAGTQLAAKNGQVEQNGVDNQIPTIGD